MRCFYGIETEETNFFNTKVSHFVAFRTVKDRDAWINAVPTGGWVTYTRGKAPVKSIPENLRKGAKEHLVIVTENRALSIEESIDYRSASGLPYKTAAKTYNSLITWLGYFP